MRTVAIIATLCLSLAACANTGATGAGRIDMGAVYGVLYHAQNVICGVRLPPPAGAGASSSSGN